MRKVCLNGAFSPDESFALQLDSADPLAGFRGRFITVKSPNDRDKIYFAGNSLGLQPTTVRAAVERELDDWAALAVDAHFKGQTPWYSYHEVFREKGARLVGANPGEVVMMNSLTVNLHLMMVSFFRPTADRYKIVIDYPTFPSDLYAVKSQLRYHGLDPADALILLLPREGEHAIRIEDVEELFEREGHSVALVMMSGVNFFTGQLFPMKRLTELGHRHGCVVGFDLAHAAGNVPLELHDWDVDFAVWCSYKYLNSGPGAVAGCFVHERHGHDFNRPRFAGWWGNDPATRFRMHLEPEFFAREGADGWQISNPPILAMAPLKASIDIFDEATMPALREKSMRLTGYLQYLIDQMPAKYFDVITPRDPESRGCQLSILVHDRPKERLACLEREGIVCDFREPNVIRVAPVPLYNTFHHVWRFAEAMGRIPIVG